jgi:hypothetical protein
MSLIFNFLPLEVYTWTFSKKNKKFIHEPDIAQVISRNVSKVFYINRTGNESIV